VARRVRPAQQRQHDIRLEAGDHVEGQPAAEGAPGDAQPGDVGEPEAEEPARRRREGGRPRGGARR
jgi:hypothetical protein